LTENKFEKETYKDESDSRKKTTRNAGGDLGGVSGGSVKPPKLEPLMSKKL